MRGNRATGGAVWSGEWVAGRLGVRLADEPTGAAASTVPLSDLVGLAVRRNPRRAHLVVSTVLGKHVPVPPALAVAAGRLLGLRVAAALGADVGARVDAGLEALASALEGKGPAPHPGEAAELSEPPVVIGYAETATALGHLVCDSIRGASYLHSTRRRPTGRVPYAEFDEAHSHATEHLLFPAETEWLHRPAPLVLVDDELTTGRTAAQTIRALHAAFSRHHYVIATLVDLRGEDDRSALRELGAELGARVDVVALGAGQVKLPAEVLETGAALVAAHECADEELPGPPAPLRRIVASWPIGLPEGGRHGFHPHHRAAFTEAIDAVAAEVGAGLPEGGRVLVLGTEELMYAPLRLAASLGGDVRFSTTTRSPVLPVDDPGYAVRTRLTFGAHDGEPDAPRYAYNVLGGGFTHVILVTDPAADTAALWGQDGLVSTLRKVTGGVTVLTLPGPAPLYGPQFSSYRPEEVAWLLTDLSGVELEAPVEEREEAIQAGAAHYAESLPLEYQPSAEYQRLFSAALEDSAERVAHAVGVVTELVLARRPAPVLASLARAGTPVGILMRRWAAYAHGLEVPHYAVSIVRGRGIDRAALRFLADRHDPAQVVFVDGWTGKGAITRELTAALAEVAAVDGLRFDPELAVLADPGRCVSLFGTREDFLIPSACLNSTVSGLVSRTVLNEALLRPGQFHGAKFYAELAHSDVSGAFLDAVTARFSQVASQVAADWPGLAAADRTPDWAGWRAVEELAAEYGIDQVNLVKPGVGETTRVLLRRVPWRVLARPGSESELRHVLLLCEQRGVPVEWREDLPFSCVGLIHPGYTRGAVGSDGRAVAAR